MIGVLAGPLVGWLSTDELEATDEGLPATDRRPDGAAAEADFGDKDEIEDVDMAVLSLCCAGSFARIASANARDISLLASIAEGAGTPW